ncbi:TonB-dependent receptor [Govanella unica]|uniref:TonB-dependent receptor n=1 Tax=Govanella unica TaxID=2975056 RepID=A0A9X3TYR6_9PROT|nr:TonB-dependent receptor [Govania unica]MDA5194420.1 TonB-dependent receptor [Govania unica]
MKTKSVSFSRLNWLSLGLCLPGLVLSSATAQAADGTNIVGLEEITVTAQRRAESLQSVPLSITAFSSEDLHRQGIVDIKAITERTPGFTMGVFNAGQPQLYIRGIGSNDRGASGDQSVIVFVDEVYLGRAAGSDMDLFDLERVEVLRGPQGTLFGKNVVGGAISFITKKPEATPEYKIEGSYGNLNARTLRGYASGALTDKIFGKISFSSKSRDGYVQSQAYLYPQFFPGKSTDILKSITGQDINTDSIRAALRFVPNDELDINVTASYSNLDQSGPSRHYVAGPGNGGTFYATDSLLIPNYANDIHTYLSSDPGLSKINTWGVTARADYHFPSMTFTSLSSFRKANTHVDDELGGKEISALRLSTHAVPTVFFGSNPYEEHAKTYTQEFRLVSSNDSALQWVAGLYYLNEKTDRDERALLGMYGLDSSNNVTVVAPLTQGGELQLNTTKSYAGFGQVTYAVLDRLKLTAGARYTYETKDMRGIGTVGGFTVLENYDVTGHKNWKSFTPKVSADYQATDEILFYASISKGFKSGGFPGLSGRAVQANAPYNPETAYQYEIGTKTEWFDRRLRVNVAGFMTDYKNLQVLQLLVPNEAPLNTPGVLFTSNAANAKIKGVELEFTAVPIKGLTLSGSYTYLDAHFSDFFIPTGYRPAAGVGLPTNRIGKKLRNSPKHAVNFLGRYDYEMSDGGTLSAQGEYIYKAISYQDPDNLPFAAVPSYSLVNGRLGYLFPSGDIEVSAWVNNLLNEDYFLHNSPNIGSGFATPAPPRTYGVTVTWKMGGK